VRDKVPALSAAMSVVGIPPSADSHSITWQGPICSWRQVRVVQIDALPPSVPGGPPARTAQDTCERVAALGKRAKRAISDEPDPLSRSSMKPPFSATQPDKRRARKSRFI